MENLKIGEGLLDLNSVVDVIEDSASLSKLLENWKRFARKLGINDVAILTLDKQCNVGTTQLHDIPHELLSLWKAEKGDKATLKALCDALVKSQIKDIADSLEMKYWLDAVKSLEIKLPMNKIVKLEDALLLDDVTKEVYEQIFNELKKNAYIQPVQLFKDHVDPKDEINYYIPRTLSYSNEIDERAFRTAPRNHLFLVKGITKNELAKLSGFQPVDVSGNQFNEISVRFMVLERDEDFNRISKKSKDPAHFIEYQNGSFSWVKSSAEVGLIQGFIRASRNTFKEDELLAGITRTISISDSPGMGKSFLLSNLALTCKSSSHCTSALLISLDELTKQMQIIDSSSTALAVIAEYASASKVAKLILQVLLNSPSHNFFLFLDGFDEVTQDKLNILNTFLKHINNLKNFRLFVTTRPHLSHKLEDVLNVMSCEILPFNESNQTEFLTKYWADKHGAECGKLLENYARECLKSLSEQMTDQEREIAGIPLQCKMLAEVYAEDAERASKMETESTKIIKITCLFDMYMLLVNLKFKRLHPESDDLRGSKKSKYVNAHVFESIKLIFPDWTQKFLVLLEGFDQIDENTLFSIGLIEKNARFNTQRFLHRTFAEYLLAEFLVKNIHSECTALMFGEVIGGKGIYDRRQHCVVSGEYASRFPAMAYFLNMHLKDQIKVSPINELVLGLSKYRSVINQEDLCKTIVSCGIQNSEILFELSTKLFQSLVELSASNTSCITSLRDKYFKLLPHFAVEGSKNVMLVKAAIDFMKITFGVTLKYHIYTGEDDNDLPWIRGCTPLHTAVYYGNYNIASYLVHEHGKELQNLDQLFLLCNVHSNRNCDFVIQDKLSIIDLLAEKQYDMKWLNLNCDSGAPLLAINVHLKLLDRLVQIGADINAYNKDDGTVLHASGNNDNWKEVLRWALSKGFKKINSSDYFGKTPLMLAVESSPVDDETLDLFHGARAKFQAQDLKGDSVLFLALKTQPKSIINKIIDYGADVNHRNKKGQNAAHLLFVKDHISETIEAVEVLEKLDVLLSKGFNLLNQVDSQGVTPFHLAMKRIWVWDHPKLFELFHSSGTDFNAQFVNFYEKETALSGAVGKISSASVAKIVECGACVNYENTFCQNVVHMAIRSTKEFDITSAELIKTLQILNSNGFNKINHPDRNGDTALYYALDLPNLEVKVIDFLYEIGADFTVRDADGWSVIPKALQQGQGSAIIKKLLDYGADLYNCYPSLKGQSLLHHFFSFPTNLREAHFKLLISELDIDLNRVDDEGRTPLHKFFSPGFCENLELLQLFYENGANFNAIDKLGNSVLFNALSSHRNRVVVLEKLLRWGVDVNHVNKNNQNAAHFATQNNFLTSKNDALDILKLLVKNKFTKIDDADKNGVTPLLISVSTGILNEEMLKCFLKNGANINAADALGCSVLFQALTSRGLSSTICESILKHGASLDHLTLSKQNALHAAIISGCISKVALVYNTGKFDINCVDNNGWTPLYYFLYHNADLHNLRQREHLLLLHAFYERGANFKAIDKHGKTLLFIAIKGGQNKTIISKLVDYGADLFHLSPRKANLLHHAAFLNNTSALEYFVDKLDINFVDEDGQTPLHHLFLNDKFFQGYDKQVDESLIELFHKYKADFNATSKGSSVLFNAIDCGLNAKIISKIVKYGGDPYYVNPENLNVIHKATYCANTSALEFFLDEVGNFDNAAASVYGNTPLHFAFCLETKKYRGVLEQLLKNSYKFDIKNKWGWTPLVSWIIKAINPFPTILELQDILPVTKEMASEALTALIQRQTIFHHQRYDYSNNVRANAFTKVFSLMRSKEAKLVKKDGSEIEWEKVGSESFSILDQIIAGNLLLEMHISRSFPDFQTSQDRNLDFSCFVKKAEVPIEVLLEALLTSKQFGLFQILCQALHELVLQG